jgi:phosphate-selective porin OprO/OprP
MNGTLASLAALATLRLLLPCLARGAEEAGPPPASSADAYGGDGHAGSPRRRFQLRSADGELALTVGGDVQADGRTFIAESGPGYPDQFLIRHARAVLLGAVQRNFAFLIQGEFAGARAQVQDAVLELRLARWARLRAGKFRVPLGLERLQSAADTAFTELALPSSNLAPNRSVGIGFFGDLAAVASYQVTVMDVAPDGTTVEGDVGDGKELAARLFLHPFRSSGIAVLAGLGVGAAASHAVVNGSPTATMLPVSYKTDGQNDFFTYVVATDKATGKVDPANTVHADGIHRRWSAQGNYLLGPLALQAEYIRSVQRVTRGALALTAQNRAWQATAGVVLTGENASFTGVVPRRDLDTAAGGWGAVELVARYAELKVDADLFAAGFADPTLSSREARAWGAGASWYLNRQVRLYADFVRTTFRLGAGAAPGQIADRAPESALMTRAQVVF